MYSSLSKICCGRAKGGQVSSRWVQHLPAPSQADQRVYLYGGGLREACDLPKHLSKATATSSGRACRRCARPCGSVQPPDALLRQKKRRVHGPATACVCTRVVTKQAGRAMRACILPPPSTSDGGAGQLAITWSGKGAI